VDVEQQRQLFERYPRAFRRPSIRYLDQTREAFEAEVPAPIDSRGIECGSGWYALVERAGGVIEAEIGRLVEAGVAAPGWPRILQVKEKFGVLDMHVSGLRSATWRAEIEGVERQSRVTCEQCGAPGELRKDGYFRTTCARCETVPRSAISPELIEQRLAVLRTLLAARLAPGLAAEGVDDD